MRDNMMSYKSEKKEEVRSKKINPNIAVYIEKIVKGLERDDIKLPIDVAGNLSKLFYAVEDEKVVDEIIQKHTKVDKVKLMEEYAKMVSTINESADILEALDKVKDKERELQENGITAEQIREIREKVNN